jgi:hypothetical protein
VVAQDVSSRKPFSTKKPILLNLNCGDLVLKSKCSQNSKCTWCTSQDLDDTCFSKSEALRLPHQVFSCGPTSSWDLWFSLLDLYCYFHWLILDATFVFLGLN